LSGEIDEIRSRIDIVDLVGSRVALKKTGKSYQGLCPFHDDKRPSFTVNPQLQTYKCWSCQEGGDIFSWVMKTQNLEFREALELLATQAGVELSRRAAKGPSKSEKALNLEIMESALEFFRAELVKSSVASDYLAKRGIGASVTAEWELGYAPDVGEALAVHLKKKGYSLSLCRTLFLVEEDSSGGYFDKFRGRLMFPIRDERGSLVAFGGRVLGDALPKYINSSDTPLYRKGKVLYGMHRAADALTKVKPRVGVLCEGYLDVIACHRAGVRGAVASLGTALSEDHAKLLSRWCDELVILYDADSAGKKATGRALEVLKPTELPVKVALMPTGDDPDTLLRTKGPAAVAQAVAGAVSGLDFRVRMVEESVSPESDQFWTALANVLTEADTPMQFEGHVSRLVSMYSTIPDIAEAVRTFRTHVQDLWSEKHPKHRGMVRRVDPNMIIRLSAKDLNPAESTLIAALLTQGLRSIAHEALSIEDLMATPSGKAFSRDYVEAFGGEAPTGEPAQWVMRLNETGQALLDQCSADQRFGQLNDRFVKDAIEKLKLILRKRQLQTVKDTADPNRLANISKTIKGIKGESR
jgi:DNA primase